MTTSPRKPDATSPAQPDAADPVVDLAPARNGNTINQIPPIQRGRKPDIEEQVRELLEPVFERHDREVRTKTRLLCAVMVTVATVLSLWYCHY